MSVAIRPTLAPFGWSIALHVAIAGLLLVSFLQPEEEIPPQGLQIEAVIVNQAVLQAAASLRNEDERRQERQAELRRKEAERIAQVETEKRAVEERRLESEQAERQKAQAAAEARHKAEEDAKQKAEQQARAKAAVEQEAQSRRGTPEGRARGGPASAPRRGGRTNRCGISESEGPVRRSDPGTCRKTMVQAARHARWSDLRCLYYADTGWRSGRRAVWQSATAAKHSSSRSRPPSGMPRRCRRRRNRPCSSARCAWSSRRRMRCR